MDLQSRILKRVPLEQPEMIPSQKQLAASICIHFGEYYLAEKEYAKAVQSYKDALSYSPIDDKVGIEIRWILKRETLFLLLGREASQSSLTRDGGQFLLCASLQGAQTPGAGGACSS